MESLEYRVYGVYIYEEEYNHFVYPTPIADGDLPGAVADAYSLSLII